MQTKTMSFIESWANIAVGYTINFIANMTILPLFGFNITVKQNLTLGVIYTVISLVRSYCIRRWFNRKEIEMKTFKDLEFKPHSIGNGLQAIMNFPNGYGISVVRFDGSYTSNDQEWELAIFHNGCLCYDTPITDDVIGHLTASGVTNIMEQVQQLKELHKELGMYLEDKE